MPTEHFKDSEFACPCCGFLVEGKVIILQLVLERIRKKTGDRPIKIESGCRCEKHNREVGGEPESAHLDGEAVDIRCGFANRRFQLVKAALEEGITRIGIGESFLHIDISRDNPRDVMWTYKE